MKFTFRDDDVSVETPVEVLRYVHEQFLIHHKTHIVSIICKDFEKNTKVIDYINSTTNWEIGIHGWTHTNYCLLPKRQIEDEIDDCILLLEKLFGQVPEKWFLPNNGFVPGKGYDLVPMLADIVLYHGIDIDIDCQHIKEFMDEIRQGIRPRNRNIYFHNWDKNDLELLPNLLYLTEKLNAHRNHTQQK